MSRKEILGRASLSFPAVDGILDVDQILQTDPWKQIDDFVQQNFTQNILNEFNERLTLEPKLTPADNTTPEKTRATSSRRSPRNSGASRTNEEKSPKKKLDDQPLEDVPKVTVEKSRATIPNKRSGECENEKKERIVDDPSETKNTDSMNDQMENTAKVVSTKSVNPSKSTDLKSPFRTSTPRRDEDFEQDNLTGKQAIAITEHNISASNSSVKRNASTNDCNARDACVTKDLSNNNNTDSKKDESKKKKVRCKHKKKKKVTKEKKPESNKISDVSIKTRSRCKKHDKQMAITETKQIGKEKHLLKQRRRRYKGKIRRIERKVDRAMETYIHHVTRIIKKIGYLPEDSSCSDDNDSYSDFSNESSYCSSYCSDSCCSYCSNGCYSSCDYSEYSLFSCSCSSSSSSPCSSPSSSSARGLMFRSKAK
ncbi:THO complex subunit 2 isoform X4 [Bombus terrestris]|uniref:THO complex subunit 2 isoform X4 n=1 Tax=Bombus terrestris TaxID=30195 RepID=A0A9B2JNL4_BOMTE|nr:THO complex subunit 2 isoform X4 [Bombus terrestris]